MIKVNFILDRTTKGAVRYEEVNENGDLWRTTEAYKVGTLYLRKTNFPDGRFPQRIVVTVEET